MKHAWGRTLRGKRDTLKNDTELWAGIVVLLVAIVAACSGEQKERELYTPDGLPAHMVSPEGSQDKPLRTRAIQEYTEDGALKSAFTLPDGYGFGVFPPGGQGDPNSITDSGCTNAYRHDPVHSVDRCNIPKYKFWKYRVTNASSTRLQYVKSAGDTVNDLALYYSSGTPPLEYTTSSSARVRVNFAAYTPEYHREKFVRVRISDSYLAHSQIGPIRRYGKCTVTINTNHVEDPPLNQEVGQRNFIQSLAMKGLWQCLGRGTDYYSLMWRCQPHNQPGISPPETCGSTGLTNADMDHVQPFFDEEIPRQAASAPGDPSTLGGWAIWGDKISLEYLWLYFEPS